MPARRRPQRNKGKKNKSSKKFYLGLIAVILLGFLVIALRTHYWQENQRLILTVNTPDAIKLVVFDNTTEEITTLVVPNSLEVDVSRNLGTWRIGSLWQLGINEKVGGKLLTETVTKSLKIPTYLWANEGADGFAQGSALPVIKAIFSPYSTNLGFGDKVRMGLFSLSTKSFKRNTIDLTNTEMLFKKSERGEDSVYITSGIFPQNLLIYVSDPIMSQGNLKAEIMDKTGKGGVAKQVGEIVEVTGPKIAAIQKYSKDDSGCSVKSTDKEVGIRLSRIFSCDFIKGAPEGNFDIEMVLGQQFAQRF